VPNFENLRRLAACLRRRTLAWPLPTRNPLYIRYWGLAWILFTEVPRREILGSLYCTSAKYLLYLVHLD
jgi:hypothetical protein